ncbi:hypothetical protein NEIG_01727 [Nematocida sp. ERTm5]|nr:hypothetical protein NEIG_01727 [Nematocida sp. ERTm5]
MFQKSMSGKKDSQLVYIESIPCVGHKKLFDLVALSLVGIQLAECKEGLLYYLSYLFICGFLAHAYWVYFTAEELFVFMGSLYWLLQRITTRAEVFFAFGVRDPNMPIFTALSSVAIYGIKLLLLVIKTKDGRVMWMQCISYAAGAVGLLYLLVRFEFALNVKRKAFHWILFFYCYLFPRELVEVHLVCAFFLIQMVLRLIKPFKRRYNLSEKRIFSVFASEKDEKEVVSHVGLLTSFICVTGGIKNDRDRMLFVLSSVGIVDSIACFFHKSIGTHKSKTGSIVGAVAAKFILSALRVEYPLWMYLIIGMAEYYSQMNDNILLPVVAYGISALPKIYV